MAALIAFATVLGVNLMPAFAPPTWSVLVLFRLHGEVHPVVLVVVGALGAALGRYALALVFRRFRHRLSPQRAESLAAVKRSLTANRSRSILGIAVYALSPVPSAQLFEAAGLLDVPLLPLVGAFFTGRIVSYSIYVAGATALQRTSLGPVIVANLKHPLAIGAEIAMILALVVLMRVDWAARLGRHPDA